MGNCSKIEGMNEYVTATLNHHLPVKNFMFYWNGVENIGIGLRIIASLWQKHTA